MYTRRCGGAGSSLAVTSLAVIGRCSPSVSSPTGRLTGYQAGVALGLALLAQEQFPDVGADVVAIIVASTVVFELTGPFLTRLAIRRAG